MVVDWAERDVEGAKNVVMKTCLAEYGRTLGKRSNTDFVILEFQELELILDA